MTNNLPEKGFYYHWKHAPHGPITDGAYEVLGTAWNTEAVDFKSENPADFLESEVVVYRPLYKEALVYVEGKKFWLRLLKNFMQKMEKDGRTVDRFIKVTDPKIISELEKIRDEMYK